MTNIDALQRSSEDVFTLSDQELSDKLHFVEEIGFGNWGSVWLCRPRSSSGSPTTGDTDKVQESNIAVKLVHRSKTPTTAARVRSLWNEMKIVRTFRDDPHPSIIPFHSFIITPSYALITMSHLPTLVPVEVSEMKCKEWFRSLLSGVEFLHKRGVVHNDIKPANILLTSSSVPVLVDFGFAEKYDSHSNKAFQSNLSYGTPEYLSPERARGMPHDTRKSDVWSLGITFFEILMGRTPFELGEGEQLQTKEDLERYWARTLKGKWAGTWKFSKGMERFLKRMITPNPELRCTASDAFADAYWYPGGIIEPRLHRRSPSQSSSQTSSSSSSSTASKPKIESPWTRSLRSRENAKEIKERPRSRLFDDSPKEKEPAASRRSTSKSDVRTTLAPKSTNRLVAQAVLSPIKASPPTTPSSSSAAKENARISRIQSKYTLRSAKSNTASPLGLSLSQRNRVTEKQPISGQKRERTTVSKHGTYKGQTPPHAPLDLAALNRHLEKVSERRKKEAKSRERKGDKVSQRVLEWERERERLREIARREESERERDEVLSLASDEGLGSEEASEEHTQQQDNRISESEKDHDDDGLSDTYSKLSIPTSAPEDWSDSQPALQNGLPSVLELGSNLDGIRQSLKLSLGKAMHLRKASVNGKVISTDLVPTVLPEHKELNVFSEEPLKLTVPTPENIVQVEQAADDNHADHLTLWARNVEKVVEDARQNFASSSTSPPEPLPALPISPPLSRSTSSQQRSANRMSKLPRKVLAASQIFDESTEDLKLANSRQIDLSMISNVSNTNATMDVSNVTGSPDTSLFNISTLIPQTPTRLRRATVSSRSPEPAKDELETGSPSKRKEKSKSYNDLLQKHISPIALLEAELKKLDEGAPATPRLSAVFADRSLFVATPSSEAPEHSAALLIDELTSSPFIVEPYPARQIPVTMESMLDSPAQRRVEGVYDRFLTSTGVKRIGKGYQSEASRAPHHHQSHKTEINNENHNANVPPKRNSRLFSSTRKAMAPPVASDECFHDGLANEFGVLERNDRTSTQIPESKHTVAIVRRAFKAIVNGSTNR